jgi:hypothetical protein
MRPFALSLVRREFMNLPDEEYSARIDRVMRRYVGLLCVSLLAFILAVGAATVLLLAPDLSWQSLLKAFQFSGSVGIVVGFICLWLGVSERLVRCAARRVYLDFSNELLAWRQT